MTLKRVISGGQTGADQGGLLAAEAEGVKTGGWAPAGYRTEDGPNPALADYGLVEHDNPNYAARTAANVMEADATLIFGRRSRGSVLTEALCTAYNKPFLWVPWTKTETEALYPSPTSVLKFLTPLKVKTLNIAGNRESVNPGVGDFVDNFVAQLIKSLKKV